MTSGRGAWAWLAGRRGSQELHSGRHHRQRRLRQVDLGPGQDGKTLQPEGLLASELDDGQQALLVQLIGYYTGLVNDEFAAGRLAEVTDVLDQTYFVWYGPTEQGSASYFRVAGPTIVIEYSPQSMGGDAADHIQAGTLSSR